MSAHIPAPSTVLRHTRPRSRFRASRSAIPRFPSRPYSSDLKPMPSFTYRLAAASSAKRTSLRPPKANQDFWTYTSTHSTPKPPYLRSTKKDAGEDAFFATTIGNSAHRVAFGVADGVGRLAGSGRGSVGVQSWLVRVDGGGRRIYTKRKMRG